jgi:hypothetical protein
MISAAEYHRGGWLSKQPPLPHQHMSVSRAYEVGGPPALRLVGCGGVLRSMLCRADCQLRSQQDEAQQPDTVDTQAEVQHATMPPVPARDVLWREEDAANIGDTTEYVEAEPPAKQSEWVMSMARKFEERCQAKRAQLVRLCESHNLPATGERPLV